MQAKAVGHDLYSEPTQTTDELGNVRTFTYDANFWPKAATDTLDGSPATVVSFNFNTNGTIQAKAVGYDLATTPEKATRYTYSEGIRSSRRSQALAR